MQTTPNSAMINSVHISLSSKELRGPRRRKIKNQRQDHSGGNRCHNDGETTADNLLASAATAALCTVLSALAHSESFFFFFFPNLAHRNEMSNVFVSH